MIQHHDVLDMSFTFKRIDDILRIVEEDLWQMSLLVGRLARTAELQSIEVRKKLMANKPSSPKTPQQKQ
jgi:hypothetical protein